MQRLSSTSHSKFISGLIIFTLFFSSFWLVNAQEPESMPADEVTTEDEIPEGTEIPAPFVTQVEALGTLVSQEDNLEVSVYVQSVIEGDVNDIRVGLELMKQSEEEGGLNRVVDTYIYPETISVGVSNASDLSLIFNPAPHLEGDYLLFLNVRDRNGRVLHWSMVDTVTLTPKADNLEIQLDTCTVQKDDSETSEPITDDLSFSPGQTATFDCQVVSKSETAYENVTPIINSYWRSPYGPAFSINSTETLVDISEGYEGDVSFQFTAPNTPNFYSADFNLYTEQTNWNSEFFLYRVTGDYGYIEILEVKEEDLRTGTDLPVTVGWMIFSETDSEDYTITLDLKDINFTACAEEVSQTIGSGSSETQLNLFVDDRCEPFSEVILSAYLRDGSNNLLDQRSVTLANQIDEAEETVVPAKDVNKTILLIGMALVTLLLIMVMVRLVVLLLGNRRQHQDPLS